MRRLFIYYLFVMLLWTQATAAQSTKLPPGHGLWTLDISANDQYIAVGGDDSLLRVFNADLSLFKQIKTGRQGMIRAVSWHPQENLLAVAAYNDMWIWNPVTGAVIKLEGNHQGSRSIAWNHNGQLLASAGWNGVVWIWTREGKLLRTIQKMSGGEKDTKDFLGIDWHPSKNLFVTVGDEIRLFDTSGIQLTVIKHREQPAGLLTVKWHPSGEFFVTGDYGHAGEGIPTLLQFWQPDGKLLHSWSGSEKELRNIRWNRSGSLLATGSDALRIWTKDGKLLHTGTTNGEAVLWGVDWTSDSKKIVTISFATGDIQLWNERAQLVNTIN